VKNLIVGKVPPVRANPPARRILGILAAIALSISGVMSMGLALPQPVSAARPTQTPMVPGRHVYDYGNLLSASARATAESLAAKIEAAGGGRVVVYTDDLMKLPNADELATAWNVDGLLLTGWEDIGTATLGASLKAKLSVSDAKFIGGTTPGPATLESWATSTLARADALMNGKHVFDGAAALDASGLAQAEAAATSLALRIGAPVYVDIAIGDQGDAGTTAFFNGADLSSDLSMSLVIALAVSDRQIGGFVDSDSALWDAYETHAPWNYDTLADETAPNGDVQAELLRAIDGVRKPPDPAEAFNSVTSATTDAVGGFFADETNRQFSVVGALVGLFSLVVFALVRWRRRRDAGYGDDESVLLPAPPVDMTPALAALVGAPLNTTRAVTTALLDLAAHGFIAFYQHATPLGPTGGIKVLSAAAAAAGAGGGPADGHSAAVHSAALDRPLGPAEERLLEGLQVAAGYGSGISHADFAALRPLFEQTGEELERIAGQRGWLRLEARSISLVWVVYGAALLVGAGAMGVLRQPVAVVCLALAGVRIMPRAFRMPLPLRTRDGQMTSAMVDAYRRTLKRALSGNSGEVPPWLANAEEAALWGYAWGLEGEVQAFVAGNVGMALHGSDMATFDSTAMESASLRGFGLMMGGLAGTAPSHPVGLDTDAMASTLGGLGRSMGDVSRTRTRSTGGLGGQGGR
jgi:Predicted membrane protein (DUF2207)